MPKIMSTRNYLYVMLFIGLQIHVYVLQVTDRRIQKSNIMHSLCFVYWCLFSTWKPWSLKSDSAYVNVRKKMTWYYTRPKRIVDQTNRKCLLFTRSNQLSAIQYVEITKRAHLYTTNDFDGLRMTTVSSRVMYCERQLALQAILTSYEATRLCV